MCRLQEQVQRHAEAAERLSAELDSVRGENQGLQDVVRPKSQAAAPCLPAPFAAGFLPLS